MSDHELFKLKKELVACRKLIEQQKKDLKLKETSIISLEEDADFHQNQSKELQYQLRQMSEHLQEKDHIILNDKPEQKVKLFKDLKESQEQHQQEVTAHRKTKDQLEATETQLQIWKDSLRQAAIKLNDETIEQDAENYRDEVMINRVKVQGLVEKSNQMSQALEQLSAENRVLRKMAGVPDDYQFELNDIVQEGQLQVEKYRAQVRALEEEVEELEEERARLRRRLRENQIGGEMSHQDVEDVDSRKASKQEIQDLKYRCKLMEEELYHYKMDGYGQGTMTTQNGVRFDESRGGHNQNLDELMKQNHEMKEQLGELIRQVQSGRALGVQQIQVSTSPPKKDLSQLQGLGQPPTPIPGAFGNYNDIKEGMSYRFQTRLAVDMNHLLTDGGGLDQMQVKFEMASLQLQNIECLRLLQEKEKEYLNLQNEVVEMKEDIRKKFLLVQDELFISYHKDKTEWVSKYGDLKIKHLQQSEQVAYQRVEIEKYIEYMQEVERKDPLSFQRKLGDMTMRSAIQDVNLIKLSRKYESLSEEYKQIKESFISQQNDYIEKERGLLEKIYNLIGWKKNTSGQMKLMLGQLQSSIPLETYHILRSQKEQGDEKLANSELKVSEYVKKIASLESSERDGYLKADKIRILEEELIEVQLEEEVIKKRLEALDPYFRKFQSVYAQMVDYIKMKNISPLQMFKQFDQNGDGKIQKNEFQLAIRDMGIPINNEEMDVLYMFVDLDGTGEIEYQEFVRRLRRSGVNVRKKEDELLFTLYRAFKDANLSLREAFETFDANGDQIISKEDMREVLKDMKLDVSSEVIDYIFKIADTSGDTQISFDEFNNLFDGIVKTQIQENSRMTVGELDWKMAFMCKIDAAVKSQSLTLLDAFKMIDRDDSQTISLREFGGMFEGMGLLLPQDSVRDLFAQMDKHRSGEISYNQLLNYLRESKLEEEKIRKLKFIQDRTQQLRDQTDQDQGLKSLGQNAVMTVESRLQMKIAILEMREKNANQRAQTLIQQLGYSEGMLKDTNKQLNDLEHQMEKSNENFFREKAEKVTLQERLQGAISKEQSEKIKRLNEIQKLQIIDINAALATYRSLYDIAVTQTKVMRITVEKTKNDHDTMSQTIKEFQSASDQNAIIGKLYHHVMISRWNEGQTNQRYEKMLDELRRLKLEEASYEAILKSNTEEIQEQTSLFRDTIISYEKQVTDVKAKLLTTVTLQRVEEQANRIREIAEMKSEAEKSNRLLREQFYELQLKADYFDIYKTKLDELEQHLKNSNTDELSQNVIEVSEKYSQCKIESLKAQRDLSMAKEKEEYYQRLNRQYTDTIKKLEYDLSNSDLNLRKREEEWRRKFYEQRKTIFQQLGVQDQGLGSDLTKNEQKNQQSSTQMDKILHKRQDNMKGANISDLEYHQLKATIEALESENKKKNIEIEGLINRQNIAGQPHQSYSSQQLEQHTKEVLSQEIEKLSMAAQQTIKCLQDIIRDKDAQVERKELQIESVKKDAMMHKKRDLDQIQQLNDLLHNQRKDRMTEQINIPQYQQQSFMQETTPVMLENYQIKLKEKDQIIKEQDMNLEAERRALKKIKEDLVRVLNEKDELQGDLIIEQKKNESEQYRKQVESLQKLVKSKTKELVNIKSTVTQLKTEVFKVAEQSVTKEQEFNTKEGRLHVNNTELEMKMKNMLNEVKMLKKDIKNKHDDLDLVKMNEIELKAKVTDLMKNNTELKALIVQSGGRLNKGDENEQVLALTQKLTQTNQLTIENATLTREIQFLKSQGQAKNLFDKEGNLQSQNNQMYFKNIEELFEGLRAYLVTKPRINILIEFERNDKDRKRTISFAKFFEILGMVGLKFKTRDLKLLQDAIKLDNLNADYYYKFYYLVKNIQDGEVQATNDHPPLLQQKSQSQLAYGKGDQTPNNGKK